MLYHVTSSRAIWKYHVTCKLAWNISLSSLPWRKKREIVYYWSGVYQNPLQSLSVPLSLGSFGLLVYFLTWNINMKLPGNFPKIQSNWRFLSPIIGKAFYLETSYNPVYSNSLSIKLLSKLFTHHWVVSKAECIIYHFRLKISKLGDYKLKIKWL